MTSSAIVSTDVPPVLEVRDVKVHFGGVKAVDGISFDITPGRIFGILGPNGSGKSTLLAAFTRYVNLTEGTLRLAGQDYQRIRTATWRDAASPERSRPSGCCPG